MTSPTLLNKFRAVRDVVADIQQAAIAVDEHVGRFQIYGSEEELTLAIARAEGLIAQAEQLESNLRHCGRPAEHTRRAEVRIAGPAPMHELRAFVS